MVLSNKKLKQKLRADMAKSLAASEQALGNPARDDSRKPEATLETQRSLKSLLDSAAQKRRLSKREIRRKIRSLEGSEGVNGSGSGNTKEENCEGEQDGVKEKKKNKKRKRAEGSENPNSELPENMEANNSNPNKKRKNKKKKKKKKAKKKTKSEKAEEGVKEGENKTKAESEQQAVAETAKTSNREENGEVSTKVYVGGIPYYSTKDDIRSYFEGCGTITEVDCMKFLESGKFRGIAIISFKTEAAAKRALALDGADMGGLILKIQPYKSTRVKKASDFTPKAVEGYNRIYVGNLSWDITEDDLKKLFSKCVITSIRFGEDKETGEFKGYAHVDFGDGISVTEALKLDQEIVCGRPVRISCAVPRSAPENNSTKSMPSTAKKADTTGTSAVSGKIRRRTCYECGEKGHLSSSCPKKQAADKSSAALQISLVSKI